jgi:hypothetical protein
MAPTAITPAQSSMLDLIDTVVVRRSYNRDGSPVWLINGARATAAQSRVITALQEKKLVRVESQNVQLYGWVGSKAVSRLVRK